MRPSNLSPALLAVSFVIGLACASIFPLLPRRIARYTFGFVWPGFIHLLAPINLRLGMSSPLASWGDGDPGPALWLLTAGLTCGLLWAFWRFSSSAGWWYILPWLLDRGPRYFRIPVLALRGFPPIAWGGWAMFQFLKAVLRGDVLWED